MILNRYQRMIAKRYLLPGKGEGFIFLVAAISLGAVALGVGQGEVGDFNLGRHQLRGGREETPAAVFERYDLPAFDCRGAGVVGDITK